MTAVWVILPTYNERENLEAVVAGVRKALATCHPPLDGTILVVDDGSPDGTGRLADRLAARHADVRVHHRPGKGGLAGAYLAGFELALSAGADLIVEMDADRSHDPADLPKLIAAARDGADVVLGSRYTPGGEIHGWSIGRRVLSRAGGLYSAIVLGLRVRDLTGGYKCFRAGALRALEPSAVSSRGYAFQIEMSYHAARAGLEIVETPIVFRERTHGRSKMSPGIALEALWKVPQMRWRTLHGAPVPLVDGGRQAGAPVFRRLPRV